MAAKRKGVGLSVVTAIALLSMQASVVLAAEGPERNYDVFVQKLMEAGLKNNAAYQLLRS